MKVFVFVFATMVSLSATAQDVPKEVKSMDATLNALYRSISGEKGEARDWELFRSLFTSNAMLVPTGKNEEGIATFRTMTPEQYIENADDWLVSNGFHEVEIHRVVEEYGPVVHVFSTYESRRSSKDKEPFARGINSIQLLNDGHRWWVMTIYWSSETPENPIPARYLPN